MAPKINDDDIHCSFIKKTQLRKMVESYRDGLDANETKSCLISLKDLNYLIDYYESNKEFNTSDPITGFRIYFYRPDIEKGNLIMVGDKVQTSLIIVPTNKYTKSPAFANDMFDEDSDCLILTPGGEHSGLCPTNCGGSE